MRRRRNHRSVCTVDSEERDPTTGVAGSGLSGTAEGRPRRREDGRLNRLGRCCAASRRGDRRAARMAASGGCIPLYACSSFKQHALLEQMIIYSALCSKVRCVVLVEASRVAEEGEEKGLRTRRGCGPEGGRGAQCGLQERCPSRPAQRYGIDG